MYVLIRAIITTIGSTTLDGHWPPQRYHQAVCTTAITIIVQVRTKITPHMWDLTLL
jgi:hypothetical protein